jgi:hypothetical protein
MAVPSPSTPSRPRSRIFERSIDRSVPGATMTAALPAKATRPMLNCLGSRSTNRWAAALADSSRSGLTSVASMVWDTSTTTMTVALSRATRRLAVGRAKPTTSSASMARNSPAGTCRRQAGRWGGDPVEQAQVGEPDRVPTAPPLRHDVRHPQPNPLPLQPPTHPATPWQIQPGRRPGSAGIPRLASDGVDETFGPW